jgi:hypothetical protein
MVTINHEVSHKMGCLLEIPLKVTIFIDNLTLINEIINVLIEIIGIASPILS